VLLEKASPHVPLVLDLDGTLIHTDTFHEMMAALLRRRPWDLLKLPFWLLKGRPFAKARLVESISLDPACLPYNARVLEFAKAEVKQGRPLLLATGSHQTIADQIATHLGLFQEVLGSSDGVNLTGPHKKHALLERFGAHGFDYMGDSRIDGHIWEVARHALVAHPKWGVLRRAKALRGSENVTCFHRDTHRLKALVLSLRPLFWVWSLLTFSWEVGIALALFSSGLLIAGDLLSLERERKHPLSPKSAFAAGQLHLITGFILAPLFILPSLWMVPGLFLYAPLFMGADWGTRLSPPLLRWLLLSLLQILSILLLTL